MFAPRRGMTQPELNQATHATPTKNFFWWQCIYISLNPEQDVTTIGRHQASCFTTITNESQAFRGTDNCFQFLRDDTTNPPSPVNHYVRDKDTVLLLKTIYSTEKA